MLVSNLSIFGGSVFTIFVSYSKESVLEFIPCTTLFEL